MNRLDTHFARVSERLSNQLPDLIARLDYDARSIEKLLADEEAQTLLTYLDEEPEARRALQIELVRDRDTIMLGKVIKIWQASVVDWSLKVVQSRGLIWKLQSEQYHCCVE